MAVEDGNDDEYDNEDVMDGIFPLVAHTVDLIKCLNTERKGNGTISGREIGAGDKILSSMQASIRGKRKRRQRTFG